MNNKKKIVVVDICYTLFKSNTTFDFFKYCILKGKFSFVDRIYFKILLSKLSPFFWMVAINEKLFKKDHFKYLAVKLLASHDVEMVESWAEDFFHEYLKPRTIGLTMDLIKTYEFSEVILISATLKPIAKSIAKNLGIDNYIATELGIKNGKYTGRILKELSGRKLEALYAFKKEKVVIDVVITDNLSDKNIMATADCKYAVCHNSKQEKFWSSLPKVNILHI